MIQSSQPDRMVNSMESLEFDGEVTEGSDLEELSDDDLDVSGGCGMRRSRLGRFGKKRGSHSSFQKHSRSISGQTITKPDGTTITSFSIQEESISSETSDFSDM